jgi:serine phosphatase RsbU (regulator of sigma subunit)
VKPGEFTEAIRRQGEFNATAPARLTPLTGRETEVHLLMDRWEQAHEGMGQVVLITGEAGLGKSRLVQTIRERLLPDSRAAGDSRGTASPIIDWYCAKPFQDTGLRPIIQYFARLLDFDSGAPRALCFDRLAQYLEDCGLGQPETIALFAKLLLLPPDARYQGRSLTPVREREETFSAVHEWLRVRASREPVLFIVEDLHWVDASTLEFLEQFIALGLHDRILTILTCRPEFRHPWPPQAHQTSIALNRLTRRQVAELTQREVGNAPPASLVTQIYERTRGNPLLVEEFTTMMRESAAAVPDGKGEMPVTLQQLVLARVDRMSSTREVAYFAAVLGREFDFELLVAAMGEDAEMLQAELGKLAGADILRVKGDLPDASYVFKHDLIKEALRDAQDEARQRQIHGQIAGAIETHFPQLAETQPELLAQHYTEAGLVEKAVAYWLNAGRRSQERSANIEAISHLTKGLEMLRRLPESDLRESTELELLRFLGTAYIAARGYASPEVGPIFERARILSERVGNPTQEFVTIRGQFAFHIVRGELPICTELAGQAMRLAEKNGDPGLLMEALFLQGLTMLYSGNFAGARECCATALLKYDDRERTAFWAAQTGEDSGVTHRCYLALAHWYLGFPDRAQALGKEACDLARQFCHPFSIGYALHHNAWLDQVCRLGAEAQALGEEEMKIAAEQGFLFWHASGVLYRASGMLLADNFEEGLRQFQKGLDAYRATGAGLALTYYLGILGESLMRAGRVIEARQILDEALALTDKHGERFHEAELHRLRGEVYLLAGEDAAAAGASFRKAIAIAKSQNSRSWELRATMSLAWLWHRQGRRYQALEALSEIAGTFAEGSNLPDLIDAKALLKELGNELLQDDLEAAIKYVRNCIPAPMEGPVTIDWRYIPASTLGGDTMGYHWIDEDHLALYLIDVTGHGLDSAMLSVTINNVIRSGTISDANPRFPNQVLNVLNRAFQGTNHGQKYFTIWYGVLRASTRELRYASGGHPPAIITAPGAMKPLLFSATGTVMGMFPDSEFPASVVSAPIDARLFIFSDGVYEIRRNRRSLWDLPACIEYLSGRAAGDENILESLIARVREIQGSPNLADDFSIISAWIR